jgi:hypothetical protein
VEKKQTRKRLHFPAGAAHYSLGCNLIDGEIVGKTHSKDFQEMDGNKQIK